jgi:hypothetical protein
MTKSSAKRTPAPATVSEVATVTCPTCAARFASAEDLNAHTRTKTTHGPCMSLSTMFCCGWRRKQGVLSVPPKAIPSRRGRPPKAVTADSIHTCVICQENFGTAEAFKAHYIPISTDPEELAPGRLDNHPCLDTDELRALDFGRSAQGTWRLEPWTQKRPADVLRLASVRKPLFPSPRTTSHGPRLEAGN